MSKTKKADHSSLGGVLILIGGILALTFPIFPLGLVVFMRRVVGEWFEMIGTLVEGSSNVLVTPHLAESVLFFIMIGAIVTIICGAIAIYIYTWVRRGEVKNGGLVAIMVGVAMVVTLHWVPGIITVIGGALCFTSK